MIGGIYMESMLEGFNMHSFNYRRSQSAPFEGLYNASMGQTYPALITQGEVCNSAKKYKTELCRTWVETNTCPYNEKCKFAHGKVELNDKIIVSRNFKLKDCKSFYTEGYCPYGPRCHFKHDERVFKNMNRYFYNLRLTSRSSVKEWESYKEDTLRVKNKKCLAVFNRIHRKIEKSFDGSRLLMKKGGAAFSLMF